MSTRRTENHTQSSGIMRKIVRAHNARNDEKKIIRPFVSALYLFHNANFRALETGRIRGHIDVDT